MIGKTYYIKTFGCQMNERDSEIMAQTLALQDYCPSPEMESADLVILNTCSIRAKAEQKVMSLLGHLRSAKAKNPGMKICVAGCVAQQEGENILKKMNHVDLVLGTQNIYDIGAYLRQAEESGLKVFTSLADDYAIPRFMPEVDSPAKDAGTPSASKFRRFVTIMQGCNNFCSYCVVPYTRGRENSRNVNDIIDEVKVLVDGGVKEITLLGQNVNSYGKTNPVMAGHETYGFAALLEKTAAIAGLERLRFTTSNPKDLDHDLISCFGRLPNLSPQFHLPVQSGSNSILRRMNRKYTVEEYLHKAEELLKVRPEIALTTDIIVGFPGETDKDFSQTMALLEKLRFHGSFSFKYSDRPGTAACNLSDKIDEKLKSERLAIFQARQDEISLERNREYLESVRKILIEEIQPTTARGRTDTNHIVHLKETYGLASPEILWQQKLSMPGSTPCRVFWSAIELRIQSLVLFCQFMARAEIDHGQRLMM